MWEKREGHSLHGRKGKATVDMGEKGRQQLTWEKSEGNS